MKEKKFYKIELADYEMELIQKSLDDCSKSWNKSKDLYKKSEASYAYQLSNWFKKEMEK